MQGKRRVSAIPQFDSQYQHQRHVHNRQVQDGKAKLRPSSKELDLLLLAGCSCLLTMLYHPVANALQSHSSQSSGSAIAAQTSTATPNSVNAFHLIVPARDEMQDEEE
ncbi:MAG: hypothetical protein NW224_22120 [Leptolyngbyaceae cyanobacterium bins.302]|nr:hypothetical protein [Leptolyngbyaceae cyanobacterium bins.302]